VIATSSGMALACRSRKLGGVKVAAVALLFAVGACAVNSFAGQNLQPLTCSTPDGGACYNTCYVANGVPDGCVVGFDADLEPCL
jgi:hypothetical protein